MSRDAENFYAKLGVSSTASETEIKAAYRKLAKELHPDTGGSAADAARFAAITQAYEALSNSESRAEYDGLSATAQASAGSRTQHGASATIEPISCGGCGQVTAQPRYVVFRHVVSFVLGTVRTPIQGIFCARCAHRRSFRATAISAVAGWWGVPWGPVWTVVEGVRNAFGGTSAPAANDRLLWHNALAFGIRGNGRLAVALADKVRRSQDRDLAAQAAKLIEHFRSQGVELGSTTLNDPWARTPQRSVPHLLLLGAVPATLVGLIYVSEFDEKPDRSPVSLVSAEYTAPPPNSSDTASAQTDAALDARQANPLPIPTCRKLIPNGKVLYGKKLLGLKGPILDINNGSQGNAIVKLRYAGSMKTAASFFVHSNDTATLNGIPDGTYVVQYAFGPSLASNCRSLTTIESAGQFPDAETLSTERTDDLFSIHIRRTHLSFTLYSIPGGNVRPETIDPATFESDIR